MKVWSWRSLVLDSDLQSTTKLVLLALSTYMNDHGEGCYPSQNLIARKCSLSDRAVRMHIALAIEAGFLVKNKRNLKGSKWASNEYEAAMPMPNYAPEREELDSAHEEKGEEAYSSQGGTSFQNGRNQVPTNSPENSSNNSSGEKFILERIKEKYGQDIFSSWFSDVCIQKANEECIWVITSTRFKVRWINDKYKEGIQEIIADIWPLVKTIYVKVGAI